jgi:hypothetical protein
MGPPFQCMLCHEVIRHFYAVPGDNECQNLDLFDGRWQLVVCQEALLNYLSMDSQTVLPSDAFWEQQTTSHDELQDKCGHIDDH